MKNFLYINIKFESDKDFESPDKVTNCNHKFY